MQILPALRPSMTTGAGVVRSHGLALILPLIMLAGSDATRLTERVVATQAADTVRIGCSGGRTGGGSGNTLTREGEMHRYDRSIRSGDTYTYLGRDSAAAAPVFSELARVRFRHLQHNEPGNMTCILELKDGEGRHDVTWNRGRPPAELAPVIAALTRAFGDDRHLWP